MIQSLCLAPGVSSVQFPMPEIQRRKDEVDGSMVDETYKQ